ncbi:MAG TPA: lysylphosphatidylglycerol synthase transmembrane domain-containing protein [Streptosporangiaceae bacterium]|nr:lysylphosphatidylglycerol synthase transmembrane domain-containing protein [Streptosporangiaceae bacterium]
MASDVADSGAGRDLRAVVRYLVGLAIGCLVLLVLVGKRGELAGAWHHLAGASAAWFAAAIAAESLSLLTFAWLQQRVLRLSGAAIPLGGLFLLTLANDAIACTVPGEPAVSSAYRYRYYRRRGASGASSGWTIFTILIAQAIGMSLLLLIGVVVALAGHASTLGAGVTVIGLILVLGAGAVLIRRDLVLRLASAVVRGADRLTRRRRGPQARQVTIAARIERTLTRMREIPLSLRSTVAVVATAAAVWGCDCLCLVCSFRAVHAGIPWHAVVLAYGVAQVVGSLPLVPGGLGIVEGSLAVVLVAYGVGRVTAVSAALAFRLVNFWLAIAVGWLSVGVIAYRFRRERASDAGPTPEAGPADVS